MYLWYIDTLRVGEISLKQTFLVLILEEYWHANNQACCKVQRVLDLKQVITWQPKEYGLISIPLN